MRDKNGMRLEGNLLSSAIEFIPEKTDYTSHVLKRPGHFGSICLIHYSKERSMAAETLPKAYNPRDFEDRIYAMVGRDKSFFS